MEAAARPVSTKRPREIFVDEFEDSEAHESDGEHTALFFLHFAFFWGKDISCVTKRVTESSKDA